MSITLDELFNKEHGTQNMEPEAVLEGINSRLNALWDCQTLIYRMFLQYGTVEKVRPFIMGFANAWFLMHSHGIPDLPIAPEVVAAIEFGDFSLKDITGQLPAGVDTPDTVEGEQPPEDPQRRDDELYDV